LKVFLNFPSSNKIKTQVPNLVHFNQPSLTFKNILGMNYCSMKIQKEACLLGLNSVGRVQLNSPIRTAVSSTSLRAFFTSEKENKKEKFTVPMKFIVQSFEEPHPDKKEKGGEDAYFISKDTNAIGVADGVGGWVDEGVDPAIYSRNLMKFTKEKYDELIKSKVPTPVEILSYAYKKCSEITGTSTACVLIFNPQKNELSTANLGDSGFLVIRSGKLFYRSKAQQHRFNYPFQIGTNSKSTPENSCSIHQLDLSEGDVIVLATDGLFDNLYDEEIINIVNRSFPLDSTKNLVDQIKMDNIAKLIGSAAHEKAKSQTDITPFAKGASENGYKFVGGKMDDITVLVAFVTNPIPQAKL